MDEVLSGIGVRPAADEEDPGLTLYERSREAFARFEATWELGEQTLERLEPLEEAVFLLERALEDGSADPDLRPLLRQWTQRLHRLAGDLLFAEAFRLQNEAEQRADEDPEMARLQLQQALTLLSRIRSDYPTSPRNDPARINRIQREIHNLEARPLYEESRRLEEEGQSLREAGDPEAAAARFRAAAEVQDSLNRRYPNIGLASTRRAQSLLALADEMAAAMVEERIRVILAEVEDLDPQEDLQLIAGKYEEAASLQGEINNRYSRSSHASDRRLEHFRVRAQTFAGITDYQELVATDRMIRERLRVQDYAGLIEIISRHAQDIDAFRGQFPKADLDLDEMEARASFWRARAPLLERLSTGFFSELQPIPGFSGRTMLRTEVPQWLYEVVSGENPSRQQGEDLPVESVSFLEAREFARRLSWMISREVRLPTWPEYRAALGDLEAMDMGAMAWTFENSRGQIQEVGRSVPNAHGFHDLAGNVAEWVVVPDRPDAVFMAGGSVRDTLSTLDPAELRSASRSDRSRLTGFRVVVVE